MAKNTVYDKDALITLALPVPDGTQAGEIAALGTDGLLGYAQTARATTENIALGLNAVGLKAGEASVSLLGVHLVAVLNVAIAATLFAAIYRTTAGAYTTVAAGNTRVGHAVTETTAPGLVEVALI